MKRLACLKLLILGSWEIPGKRLGISLGLILFFLLILGVPLGYPFPASADNPPFTLSWFAADILDPQSVAWGDVDNDGDLDLAIGGLAPRVLRNDNGVLTSTPVWSPSDGGSGNVAWGDFDNDGDLDLAVGGTTLRLYRNDNGVLTSTSVWSPSDGGNGDVAWGDVDNDGDLDLATATALYRNDYGVLETSSIWSPSDGGGGHPAWGDYDGDGDLDLGVGGSSIRLYRNDNGVLTPSVVWSLARSLTCVIAWGDYDSDGDLDLAVGGIVPNPKYGPPIGRQIELFRNDGVVNNIPQFVSVWLSTDKYQTYSIGWGDYDVDGDLDLIVGNWNQPNSLFRNDNGVLTTSPVWSAVEADTSHSLAWGDVDGDGDLDLAVAASILRLYRNDSGVLLPTAAWSGLPYTNDVAWGDYDGDGDLDLASAHTAPGLPYGTVLYRNDNGVLSSSWSVTETATSIAWGDYDGDGDLDLAAAGGAPVRLYRNDNGALTSTSVWSPSDGGGGDIAWGDVDNDGDLDLAVGAKLYRNDNGVLTSTAVWSPSDANSVYSVAWGDVDNDGDLDLAVGAKLYRNDNGVLTSTAVWSSSEANSAISIAWGDVDGDGDLDLVIGNDGQPNRLYRNDNGALTTSAAWSSAITDPTSSIAWGDYDGDGDLDLAVGNRYGQPNRLYRNDNGVLTSSPVWSSVGAYDDEDTHSVAWGDVDGDGDLDLVAGNYARGQQTHPTLLYRNTRDARSAARLPGAQSIPVVQVSRPSSANADFYSSPRILPTSGSTIPINYKLLDPQSQPVKSIRAYYSINGAGGRHTWLAAVPISGTKTTDFATSPGGIPYTYNWDVFASGFFGQSDNVVFRLVAVPDVRAKANSVPGPFMYGSYASQTFPFRVRGTQVRVMNAGTSASNAMVYRLPKGQTGRAVLLVDNTGQPFRTDLQGYLQGRGSLNNGDQLFAVWPVSATQKYTLYYTNAGSMSTVPNFYSVGSPGVQTLSVSSANPLYLFNLDVSLEWDARKDSQFLSQLDYDLHRTSEVLYDWTNGQVALGQVNVYYDRKNWSTADLRIYATNRIRPNATRGGYVSRTTSDPLVPSISYNPGQVRIGAVWNRYGDSAGTLGEDWPRTLAHELGHYFLFLDDDYLGLDANSRLIPVDTCTGTAMSDPYRDDYSEFKFEADWHPGCDKTLSEVETHRSDWTTLKAFYPDLNNNTANSGPISLPLAVTKVSWDNPGTTPTTLDAPIYYITKPDGSRYQPGPNARAFLFQTDRLTDLGRATLDQVNARGARVGDRLCLYEPTAQALGCKSLAAGDSQLTVYSKSGWQPEIQVSPVTSSTIDVAITASDVLSSQVMQAQLYPGNGTPSSVLTLTRSGNGQYNGTFNLAKPAAQGYVHVWVNEASTPRREMVTDYSLGSGPGYIESRDTYLNSGPGYIESRDVTSLSADGRAIIFAPTPIFSPGEFYTLQATTNIPGSPTWVTVVGPAYRLSKTPGAPSFAGTTISIRYAGSEVPAGEESLLRIYYWPTGGSAWQELATTLDAYHNMTSAPTQGEGYYALMSSIQIPLAKGWNLIAYPVLETRPVATALASINGYYATVYGYVATDSVDPWKIYDVGVPSWVNDLVNLEYGRGYWIKATQPVTLSLKGNPPSGAAMKRAMSGMESRPATYYGVVQSGNGYTAGVGQTLLAQLNSVVCGQALTQNIRGQVVYTLNVLATGPGGATGCGVPRKPVVFRIGGRVFLPSPGWDDEQVWNVPLAAGLNFYLPFIQRMTEPGAPPPSGPKK